MRECYYFPHFADARNDPKIIRLLMKHGMSGYGIFWALYENLRTAKEYAIAYDSIAIAYQLQSTPEQIKSIIEDFGLFENKDGFLWSPSLKIRLQERSEKYRVNALKRKDYSSNRTATNMLQHSKRKLNYAKKGKERKGKESKSNNIFTPPTLQEVTAYKIETLSPVEPQDFIDFYSSKGWKVGRESMRDWKASFRRAKKWDCYKENNKNTKEKFAELT